MLELLILRPYSVSSEIKQASRESSSVRRAEMGSVVELKFSERSGRKPISLATIYSWTRILVKTNATIVLYKDFPLVQSHQTLYL